MATKNIKKKLKKIANKNLTLNIKVNKLDFNKKNIIDDILGLIDEFGIHPKLIIQLAIALQLDEENKADSFSSKDIENLLVSSLNPSMDAELLYECRQFLDCVIGDSTHAKSIKLVNKKLRNIKKFVRETELEGKKGDSIF
jgi:hypothetical protein